MIIPASSLRRWLAAGTAFSMALPALPAFAQEAAPPSRVGQIASLNGNVSFDGSGSGGWAQAVLNYPVTSGDTLYTQDSAEAAIALDSSKIFLAPDTELQVTGLDQNNFAATQSQGEAVYAIDDLQPGQQYTVTTPRGTVGITQNGQYDVAAGDANNPTTVNVFQGAATVTAPGASQQVTAGQAAYLSGADQTTMQLGQAQQDSFASSVLAQNAPPPPAYAPPVVQQMTGTPELSQYGSWDQSAQYGAVWYPNVAPGWAPYRNGYWANVQPWGWTWVESEPWGFAPFHYGRWFDDGGRWGWAPAPAYDPGSYGPSYQPVYAPAVVSFFGVAAAGITAALLSSGSVGWVPLAPNEPYYPTYRAPPGYIRQINYVNVRNINNVDVTNNYYGGNFTPDRLANRGGATYVPADVMRSGEHVGGYAHPAPQAMLASARPVDPGFGNRPAGQAAAYRLPEAGRSLAEIRPGTAPRQTDFAQRRSLAPATVSHEPFAGHPGAAPTPHEAGPMQAANHPGFATAPGYHAPPAPPAPGVHRATLPPVQNARPGGLDHAVPRLPVAGQHPGALPAQNLHPAAINHAMPQVLRPETAPAFHPQAELAHPTPEAPAFHPQTEAARPAQAAQDDRSPVEANHPPIAALRPPAEAYRPPQVFHPAAESYHPPAMAQPRPMEIPHPAPAPHPEAAHPEPQKHPG